MGCFHLRNESEALNKRVLKLTEDFPLERDILINTKKSSEGLSVILKKDRIEIAYHRLIELFRGVGFLMQWMKEGKQDMEYRETPVFHHLTYMADCSRNAVLRPEYVKTLIHRMALMGYDRLMLYTEDTYEVDGYPFFGYLRGRYTKEELRMMDDYAAGYGIELVPCIQTLAHLNCLFHWNQFEKIRDTGDILCCGLEETYELIEAMIRTFAQNCRSRVINIGMDEAEMIGRGNYIKHFGYEECFDVMEKHLKRVVEICRKYGYTCMMWSDMFFKMLSGGKYYDKDVTIPGEVQNSIPEGVELVYWDYYSRNGEVYESMLKLHKQLAATVGFAGGAWKWSGFAPLLNHSMEASRLALKACMENKIQNVIVTGWGDDGGEASQAAVLPVLSLYAEFQYAQNMEDCWVEKRLEACTGAVLKDFLKLDLLNLTPDNPSPGKVGGCPAKYLLYQDILLGIYDRHVDARRYPKHFQECYKELSAVSEKSGPYGYLFDTLAGLARILEIKSDLGIRLKQAYDCKNTEELTLIETQCKELAVLIEEFKGNLKIQWMAENKVFGFEVQDIRLGGLKERICTAMERIRAYLDGKTDKIEELEEERLLLVEQSNPGNETIPLCETEWKKIVTACVL